MSSSLPPPRRSARLRSAGVIVPRDLVEGDTVPCILAVTTRRPPGGPQDADDPHPTSFVVRHTTPIPEEPLPNKVPASPFMPTAATDALAKSGDSSPLKSVSWSSQTVAQFDDRCVQVALKEMKTLIGGREVQGRAKRRLKSFRGVDVENLPDNSESSKYSPVVSRTCYIPEWLSLTSVYYSLQCEIFNAVEEIANSNYRWKIVANHGESNEVDHRPDLARYVININAAKAAYGRKVRRPDDSNIARCAWAWMSSFVEIKNEAEASGFHFSDTRDENGELLFLRDSEDGKIARAQFIKYATEAMLRQHRTHYYSIYIAGMSARVFRWDRVGCLVTEPIDLRHDYNAFLDLLHCLATANDDYGADQTVERATEADILPVRLYESDNVDLEEYRDMMLDDPEVYPIYKVKCPAVSVDGTDIEGTEKTYLVGRYAFGHYSIFGRCTRGYAAFNLEDKRFVWFKDQWRCVTRPYTELDAYVRLHAHNVSFIATPVAGGDIDDQLTISQQHMTHLSEEWRPSVRVHTRLVTKEVGKLLESYTDSPDLLRICRHAFIAHQRAYQLARILHRDISIGNIMINVETGYGFLNDWDLCKYREDLENSVAASEPSGISGTWAFKSSFSLEYPRKPPELADDMESFIHVITFFAFRYHRHKASPVAENTDSESFQKQAASENNGLMGFINGFFYEQRRVSRGYYQGGSIKRGYIETGKSPVALLPLPNGRRPLIAEFLDGAYLLLREHYEATEPGRYDEFAVQQSDNASPDEVDESPPNGPPEDSTSKSDAKRSVPVPNEEEEEAICLRLLADGGWRLGDGRRRRAGASTSSVNQPRRVLDDYEELGKLFVLMFMDENGKKLDLTGLRDDKRFDQFRSWHEFGWTQRKGKSGVHRTLPRDKIGSQQLASLKRRREDEDVADTEPAAKRATPPCDDLAAQTGKASLTKLNTQRKRAAAPRAKAESKTQKATASRKRATLRKTVKFVEPEIPLTVASVKAEVTRKMASTAKIEVVTGTRRSKRLAERSSGV
ncbi:uncharacterized protein PHACADRAFT_208163 [Phanerochaete carnosa HHB-10118-sp]|uniref:Fungal-type protein kinase domain-containing protein n=1 Tax=Phanerochaete carnosa (strain HHB-10118-sp) TaxID=650164 RepID=K5VZJ2_PHACS|nr:uncharacterized protein PHACADRAFT_208163 [Phanerochaete carnosa HHB-10118-sp]EKM56998.1 hypothetical protein PHACADRAFT_208163 [Phanerochaete carnosa HHB-10118-sp]